MRIYGYRDRHDHGNGIAIWYLRHRVFARQLPPMVPPNLLLLLLLLLLLWIWQMNGVETLV